MGWINITKTIVDKHGNPNVRRRQCEKKDLPYYEDQGFVEVEMTKAQKEAESKRQIERGKEDKQIAENQAAEKARYDALRQKKKATAEA